MIFLRFWIMDRGVPVEPLVVMIRLSFASLYTEERNSS